MRRIDKRITYYQCSLCKTPYPSPRAAARCEASGIEKRAFKINDRVRAKEKRTCSFNKNYICRGAITAIKGPAPFDADVMKWILNALPNPCPGHFWEYIIAYTCPICKMEEEKLYYAVELERDNRRK
ncbi:MAG: hypothetical protein AAB731_03565 [Patescibacteria group bacterium]